MLTRARSKLTYSNVVSSLCLVAVVGGGTAIAATTVAKNTVTSKSIKNESVQGKDVKNDSLTGDDVNESSLKGVTGPAGPQGPQGDRGPAGPAEGPAGGDLTGNYPNPEIAANAVGSNEVANNSLTSADIDEASISPFVNGGSDVTPLDLTTTYQTVVSAGTIGGENLITATADVALDGADADNFGTADCAIFGGSAQISPTYTVDFDRDAENKNLAITFYEDDLSSGGFGISTVSLRCQEPSGGDDDVFVDDANITVVRYP